MSFFQETKDGYRYDKRIFWGAFIIVLIACFSLLYKYNFDIDKKLYVKCPADVCDNPVLNDPKLLKYCTEDWCKQKTLSMGEYGVKPVNDPLINSFPLFVFIVMGLTIPINHIIHNRGKRFQFLDSQIPKWLKKGFKKISNELED